MQDTKSINRVDVCGQMSTSLARTQAEYGDGAPSGTTISRPPPYLLYLSVFQHQLSI